MVKQAKIDFCGNFKFPDEIWLKNFFQINFHIIVHLLSPIAYVKSREELSFAKLQFWLKILLIKVVKYVDHTWIFTSDAYEII